jgi:hypothetical protein
MRIVTAVFMAGVLAAPSIAAAQTTMTPQQFHKKEGACACPDDKDSAGKKCGKRSAFCREGGTTLQCFRAGDIAKRKKEACG